MTSSSIPTVEVDRLLLLQNSCSPIPRALLLGVGLGFVFTFEHGPPQGIGKVGLFSFGASEHLQVTAKELNNVEPVHLFPP